MQKPGAASAAAPPRLPGGGREREHAAGQLPTEAEAAAQPKSQANTAVATGLPLTPLS